MNRIPNNSSLQYERNIFNFKNVYPIREDTSLLNPLVFYNTNTKEVTYSATPTTILTSNSTYTMPSTRTILIATASSNAITITLPTAVGISGVMYKIIRTDTTLANPITIITTSSQTIGGSGTSRKMYTANEVWEFVSDGANWIILNHFAKTGYISAGSQTITSTSDPQPGVGTTSLNELKWKRDGKMIHVLFGFNATSTPSAGTGDYLFTVVPSGITIDTSIYVTYTTPESSGFYDFLTSAAVGHCTFTNATNSGIGILGTYSSTQMRMFFSYIVAAGTLYGAIGQLYFPITNLNRYDISCLIPISEFDE